MKRYLAPVILGLSAIIATDIAGLGPAEAAPVSQSRTTKKKQPAKKTPAKQGQKKNQSKTGTKKSGASTSKSEKSGSKSKGRRKETSADVRKQQEATQKEIRLTQQQIKENDAAVSRNLTELGRLQGDIDVSKKRVAEAGGKVTALQKQIDGLQTKISADEKQLSEMRAQYLKAIKKMRAKKKNNSTLAFIFSSSSFNEALRRMRYLRQFADWRDRKSAEISGRVAALRTETERLSQTKAMHSKALSDEVKARDALQTQYARQDAIVVDLKKNGQALKTHLSQKQAEANALKGRIASLIAEEQRKAEAERREREAREAAARKAEQERLAREEAEARKEQQRKEAEALVAQNEQPAPKETPSPKKAQTPKEQPKKEQAKKEQPKKEANAKTSKSSKKETRKQSSTGKSADETSYAEARRRKPRATGKSEGSSKSTSKGESSSKSAAPVSKSVGGNFESMKGALPKPVAGSFRVTSRFGRHSLPDLPDVVYDNPGIDAEVAAGASAQAVFAGKVSGVYMIPGYSTVVIVNHGNYYTVYGNIASAAVKVGDVVKQGQSLGRLAAEEDNPSSSSIHFEVWKNRDKLDPMQWIR